MDYPLSTSDDGVKIRPELMKREKLYHCIFKDKALLIFKDSQDFLNCYEVEDNLLVDQIKKCKSDFELESIFDDYLKLEKHRE